jgi:hypothetical protein
MATIRALIGSLPSSERRSTSSSTQAARAIFSRPLSTAARRCLPMLCPKDVHDASASSSA